MSEQSTQQKQASVADVGRTPGLFVLETVFKGKRRIVADGVAFPPPDEQVVVNWRRDNSVELIDTVADLYERYGDSPRVRWRDSTERLTDAAPADVIS